MNVRKVLGAVLLAGVVTVSAVVPAVAGDAEGRGGKGGVRFLTLETELSGAAEVPGPGDDNGTGVAQVNLSKSGGLCFAIAVEGITLPATAAHIHQGAAGVAGDIVVTLAPPEPFGSGAVGVSAGCLTDVSRSVLRGIASSPDQYYVNVHNADFPAGAVRGQLAVA
jgi:hypothetical protein